MALLLLLDTLWCRVNQVHSVFLYNYIILYPHLFPSLQAVHMSPKDNPPWQENSKVTTETEDDIGFATFGREALPQQISNPPSENPHNVRDV